MSNIWISRCIAAYQPRIALENDKYRLPWCIMQIINSKTSFPFLYYSALSATNRLNYLNIAHIDQNMFSIRIPKNSVLKKKDPIALWNMKKN